MNKETKEEKKNDLIRNHIKKSIVVEYRGKSSARPKIKDKARYSILIRRKSGKSTKEEKWRYGPVDTIV